MWADLQEAFFLVMGPLIVGLILPVFGGAGIIIAVLMAVQQLWRPLQRVRVIRSRSDLDD